MTKEVEEDDLRRNFITLRRKIGKGVEGE